MTHIEVSAAGEDFRVVVTEGGGQTRHVVRAGPEELRRLAPGVAPTQVIEAAFRFLLDREAKESILARFRLGDISRYFPEFEVRLSNYLPR